MRIPVHKQREVARLHFYDGKQSSRAIGRATDISANTVSKLRVKLTECGCSWPELCELDDDAWEAKLQTQNQSPSCSKPAPDWMWVQEQMSDDDATLDQIWREWRLDNPDGIGYTQFTAGYARWKRSQHITMRMVHAPGNKAFVDFAGRTVEILDRDGGPSTYAKIFIAVLGYSSYTFILAVPSERVDSWVTCHIEFFLHIGGVPRWVVCDNLKSAVIRRERDFIHLNRAYKALLAHYDTAADPAKPRGPKGKAKAEVGVQIVQRSILFPLRHRKFFSIDELNAELARRCKALNEHPFKKMAGSRLQRFLEVEERALKPLPDRPYESADWQYEVRVHDDHHCEVLGCAYSVPYQYALQTVDIKVTARLVEIYRRGHPLATHQRLFKRGARSTHDEHRPVGHRRVLDGEPKALLEWSRSVGPSALRMVSYHIESRTDITNGLKAARTMRALARDHSDARFEAVCAYALARNITTLRSIRSIITSGADSRPQVAAKQAGTPEAHQHVRGATYFGNKE